MELLAPAGNLECALAAFDAGADAVYCGLKRFNARERTENFSPEEMSKLIAYAHKHGKKVYVTFNTLIREDELLSAAEELAELEQLRPDAVIMQDAGIIHLAKTYFPGLILHGSTQMGIHNSAGLLAAKKMGLSRVILERQTPLNELEKILQSGPGIEVELFIHGALCCCISGSCLLSSWLGGWSGNRGKCKQPCRRRHHSAEGNGFFLSAQDLETLSILPRLLKSGAVSFKIEGRLRRSDYVTHVVSAYRMAMDAAAVSEEEFRNILPQAKAKLARTLGRKWSLGYYTKESAQNLIKHDQMGVSGLLCGKVLSRKENGFTAEVHRNFYLGDMVRVQPSSGDEGPAFRITKMSLKGKGISRAGKGEEVFIHTDREIPGNGLLYKIGEKTADYTGRIAQLKEKHPSLDLNVFLSRREFRVEFSRYSFRKTLALEEAQKAAFDPERIREELKKIVQDSWETGRVEVTVEGNPFLPSSVLKSIRKEFENEFLPACSFTEEDLRKVTKDHLETFRKHYREIQHSSAEKKEILSPQKTVLLPRGKHLRSAGNVLLVRSAEEDPSPHEELLLPYYTPEYDVPALQKRIRENYERGVRVFRVSSWSHLTLLEELEGITLKSSMPLPVCNSMASEALARFGIRQVQASPELGKEELRLFIRNSPLDVEQYCFGRPVLLSTRAALPVRDKMSDTKGECFRIRREGILTRILPEKIMNVPPLPGAASLYFDCSNADEQEKGPYARFNFDVTLA